MESSQPLGPLFLRTVWIFQAIVAGPIFVFLGILAIFNMFNTWDTLYDFVTHIFTSMLAAGIIFVVLIQRKIPPSKTSKILTLKFEVAKSILATLLWLWLLLDAIFGPSSHYNYYGDRSRRIAAAALSALLLFILFYPTVIYTFEESKRDGSDGGDPEAAHERSPLLREGEGQASVGESS